MTRSEKIRAVLAGANGPMGLRQIMDLIGEPADGAKFVSSTLNRMVARGEVIVNRGPDSYSGRQSCLLYSWATATGAAHARTHKAAGAAKQKTAKAKTAPPPPPKMDPAEQARADAKRKAADQARQQRTNRANVVGLSVARETFERLTGYEGTDPIGMKQAYRAAAMRLHPDRHGGDHGPFAILSAAWDQIQKSH